ncbi:type VI secretion system (T6SS) VasI/EvfG family protein [Vreelandella songnenensis]|uniref:Type VI secretion system (T6SS) VasI/EvfG family protein n=1 Tax=Vreelandella songnenensis TaxID=1176243 RepID=A0A2T0V1H1_9GAMM|nr:type VI secretion system-associated protein TagO [Halomonas songnenensis]PRY64025.1 type VI secretion system (T6SS) VasI/EvfG family protein [Halomonas songnenensis]
MKTNQTRLLAILTLLPTMALAQGAPTGSQWQTEEHHDEELDLHFVVLETHAVGLAVPTVVFRCFEDTTVAYFDLFDQDESNTYEYEAITVALDDAAPQTIDMQPIDDGHALGFWQDDEAIPFIQGLFGAQTLRLNATPVDGTPIELEFNIEGIEERVKSVRETCGW